MLSVTQTIHGIRGGEVNILGSHSTGHSKQKSVYVCVLFWTVSEVELFWLYSSRIVDMREILHTVSSTGTYCSSDKVGTVYLVEYIFKNSTIDISALCNSCEYMAHCSSVQCKCTAYWSSSVSETVRNRTRVHIHFLLRMTDTMTSQNIELSSWVTLYSIQWSDNSD
jgi:hypothetical protein